MRDVVLLGTPNRGAVVAQTAQLAAPGLLVVSVPLHAATAIEGNTLSEEQVIDHLAGRLELPRSQAT